MTSIEKTMKIENYRLNHRYWKTKKKRRAETIYQT